MCLIFIPVQLVFRLSRAWVAYEVIDTSQTPITYFDVAAGIGRARPLLVSFPSLRYSQGVL